MIISNVYDAPAKPVALWKRTFYFKKKPPNISHLKRPNGVYSPVIIVTWRQYRRVENRGENNTHSVGIGNAIFAVYDLMKNTINYRLKPRVFNPRTFHEWKTFNEKTSGLTKETTYLAKGVFLLDENNWRVMFPLNITLNDIYSWKKINVRTRIRN